MISTCGTCVNFEGNARARRTVETDCIGRQTLQFTVSPLSCKAVTANSGGPDMLPLSSFILDVQCSKLERRVKGQAPRGLANHITKVKSFLISI